MDGYGAEGAFPIASAMGGYGVLYGVHGLHGTFLRIERMDRILVVQEMDPIQLGGGQVPLGRILDKISVSVPLDQTGCGRRVAVLVEHPESLGEHAFIRDAFLVRRHLGISVRDLLPDIAYALYRMPVLPVPHALGQLEVGQLRHAVGDGIGLGVEDYAPAQGVGPCVVMDRPPKTRLDAAEDYGSAFGEPPDQIGIYDAGAVGTSVVDTSRSEVVVLAELAGRRVVGHHGVDAARGDRPEEPRDAEAGYVGAVGDIGLAYDPRAKPVVYEPMTDDGRTVVRRVYVGVPRDDDDVEGVPSPLPHLLGRGRYEHLISSGT